MRPWPGTERRLRRRPWSSRLPWRPVSCAGGAAQRPVEELSAGLGGLYKRGGAEHFANVGGQIELCPAGLEVEEAFGCGDDHGRSPFELL